MAYLLSEHFCSLTLSTVKWWKRKNQMINVKEEDLNRNWNHFLLQGNALLERIQSLEIDQLALCKRSKWNKICKMQRTAQKQSILIRMTWCIPKKKFSVAELERKVTSQRWSLKYQSMKESNWWRFSPRKHAKGCKNSWTKLIDRREKNADQVSLVQRLRNIEHRCQDLVQTDLLP